MDPLTLALLGGAFGSKLGSALFGVHSERDRRRKLQQQQLANLSPLEALVTQSNFGPSQTEGYLAQNATSSTLSSLADRGVLNSSIAAPAVARAVAPIEEARQARRMGLIERLTAAKNAIYGDNSLPGYGSAFADALGQGGDVLALLAGERGLDKAGGADALGNGAIQDQATAGSAFGGYTDNPALQDLFLTGQRRRRRQPAGAY